jgi:hypothetical protein
MVRFGMTKGGMEGPRQLIGIGMFMVMKMCVCSAKLKIAVL